MSRLLLGPHAVREALRARAREVSTVHVARGADARELVHLARERGVPVLEQSRAELDGMAGGDRHQGVLAVAGEYSYWELDSLLAKAKKPELLLVLDGVQDPQNLGALCRSACVFGADLVIPRDRAARVTPAVVRASAGTTEHVRIALVTNVARTIEALKERGLCTAAAVVEQGEAPHRVDLTGPLALVVGGEEKGVRRLVAEHCDFRLTLPSAGSVGVLNASVAGAVLLYEVKRQRGSRS